MSVIMNFLTIFTIFLIIYIRTVSAFPRSRRSEEMKAPEHFCNNITNSTLKDHCKFLNERVERFCSKKLASITSDLCQQQYHYPDDRGNQHLRIKRNLADDCCKRPCSRSYIIYWYCPNPEARIEASHSKISSVSPLTTEGLSFYDETLRRRKLYPQEVSQHIDKEVKKISKKKKHHGKKVKGKKRKRKCGCPFINKRKTVTYKPGIIGKAPIIRGPIYIDHETSNVLPPYATG